MYLILKQFTVSNTGNPHQLSDELKLLNRLFRCTLTKCLLPNGVRSSLRKFFASFSRDRSNTSCEYLTKSPGSELWSPWCAIKIFLLCAVIMLLLSFLNREQAAMTNSSFHVASCFSRTNDRYALAPKGEVKKTTTVALNSASTISSKFLLSSAAPSHPLK